MEDVEECQACKFEAPRAELFLNDGKHCNLCYGTMASTLSHSYDYPGETLVIEAICFVGNTILKAIRDSNTTGN